MNKKNIIILVVVVVVVGAVVWLLWTGAIPSPRRSGTVSGTRTPQGTVVATGTSPVTDTGEVLNRLGEPAKLNVLPGSPEAPQESNPISPEDLPSEAIKLTITAAGISPSSFTVRAGAPVTISVTAGDTQTHIFKFDSPSLSAVAVGVSPGETRAITFNAPGKGTYGFHCDVPGHASRGETGTMTVR